MQLLTIPVAVGVLDFSLDLCDATSNVRLFACAFDDRGVVLGDDNLASLTKHVEGYTIELEANLFGNNLATGEDCHVLQH